MTKTKTLEAKKVAEIGELEIFRCAEKRINLDGEAFGQTIVWYDVISDENIIESFKTLNAAKKFAKDW